jgi:hypothetical protein
VTNRAVGLLVLALAALAGLAVGVVGTFLHRIFVLHLPVGLVAGLALSVAVMVYATAVVASRVGAVAAFLGWLLAVASLSLARPEGDVVLAAQPVGYVWLFGGTLIGGLCIGLAPLLVPRAWRPPTERPPSGR